MPQLLEQIGTPKRLSKQRLTDKLVSLIFNGKTKMTENAKTLGIGRTTAYRYWNQWVDSEESQQIDVEWWASFKTLKKKSPVKAFEGLTRLKLRKMPQKVESKTEILEERKISVDINATLREYQAIIRKSVDNTIPSNRVRKPLDPTQTHT